MLLQAQASPINFPETKICIVLRCHLDLSLGTEQVEIISRMYNQKDIWSEKPDNQA